jgi:hypothetical protein
MKATKENPQPRTVTIARINKKEFDGKHGKSWKIGIQTKEAPDVWVNGFVKLDSEAANWKEGDVVEILCWKDPKWGLQFKLKSQRISRQEFEALQKRVDAIENKLNLESMSKMFDAEPVEESEKNLPF